MTYRATAGEGSESVSGSGQSLFDKVREAEAGVLGTILISPETFPRIKARLKPEGFQHEKHRTIYRAMLELYDKGRPIELLSLYDLLKERGELEAIGESTYLTYLTDLASPSQSEKYEAEAGRILEWMKNGGTIKWEVWRFIGRNRNGKEVTEFDY